MEHDAYYAIETSAGIRHYGRKGMRWGMHIFGKDRVSRNRRKRTEKTFADYDRRSASTSSFDDDSLRRYVNRKQQESTFKRMAIPDHSETGKSISGGTKLVSNLGKYAGWGISTVGKVTGKKSIQSVGKLVTNLSGKADNLSNAISKTDERAQKRVRKRLDLSTVSDQDLQRAINRKTLESSYERLSSEDTVKGKEYVDSVQSYLNIAIGAANEVRSYKKDPTAYLGGDKKKNQQSASGGK